MKRIISLILVILIITLTFSGCSKISYSNTGSGLGDWEWARPKGKLESNKRFYNVNNVVFDLYYGFYDLSTSETKYDDKFESNVEGSSSRTLFIIYINNSKFLKFNESENGVITDYENGVNAELVKVLDGEERRKDGYGYTVENGETLKDDIFHFQHSEKINIPAKYFASSKDVYVHLIYLIYDAENGGYIYYAGLYSCYFAIDYVKVGNTVIIR